MYETFNLHPSCLVGSNSCFLGNSNSLNQLFGDPFPGVAKHVSLYDQRRYLLIYFFILYQWHLSWSCSDIKPSSGFNTFYACDNVAVYPVCPKGLFISSGSLKYGRWDNGLCPGPGVNSSTQSSFGIFNLPARCLQGVDGCNVGSSVALIQTFGDPMPGVSKHVRI